ncbi:hypothetical protein TRICI_005618 [Trichomonascus ciferrii]|uniref:Uncharacterized protein n=1 Tax=Trichomonascus ciferrii TaxID=44093 RepID=A0A642URF5_9ASCO|nr:hypothetical protein TRICI_005618 [Trichomonascus ciferrii]
MNIPPGFHVEFRESIGDGSISDGKVEQLVSKINESALRFTTELRVIGNRGKIVLGDKITSLKWVMEPERGWPPKMETSASCLLNLFLENSIRNLPAPDIHQNFGTFKLKTLELDNYTINADFSAGKPLHLEKLEFRNCDANMCPTSDRTPCTAREVIVYMSDCQVLYPFDFTDVTRLVLHTMAVRDEPHMLTHFAQHAAKILLRLTTLKTLDISGVLFIKDDILEVIKQLQILESIHVRITCLDFLIHHLCLEHATDLTQACPNIKQISCDDLPRLEIDSDSSIDDPYW